MTHTPIGLQDVRNLELENDMEFMMRIVTACNAHDELVAALKGMIELMDNKPTSYEEDLQISKYRKALAKAEKGV